MSVLACLALLALTINIFSFDGEHTQQILQLCYPVIPACWFGRKMNPQKVLSWVNVLIENKNNVLTMFPISTKHFSYWESNETSFCTNRGTNPLASTIIVNISLPIQVKANSKSSTF